MSIPSLFSLQNRTALVTGGTRGIGAQMAIALAEAGADVILVQVFPLLTLFARVWILTRRYRETHQTNKQNKASNPSAAKHSSTQPTCPLARMCLD